RLPRRRGDRRAGRRVRRGRPAGRAYRDGRGRRRAGRARRPARRRRPALACGDELRPVRELRGARRGLPRPRGGARVKKGQLEATLLVLVTLGLVAFGLVMVYSATSAPAALGGGDPGFYLKRQTIYALIGLGLMFGATRIDYRRL